MTHILPLQERLRGQREPNEMFMNTVAFRQEASNIHNPYAVLKREATEQRPHYPLRENLSQYRSRMYALGQMPKSGHTLNGDRPADGVY